jgi:hypothetical protein
VSKNSGLERHIRSSRVDVAGRATAPASLGRLRRWSAACVADASMIAADLDDVVVGHVDELVERVVLVAHRALRRSSGDVGVLVGEDLKRLGMLGNDPSSGLTDPFAHLVSRDDP